MTAWPDTLPAAFRARYLPVTKIGEGGMGVVWRAQDTQLDRPVAVKLLIIDQADARARFAREARALARVRHPNVTAVYEVGVDGGVPFLVSELVEGGALNVWVRKRAPVPLADACRVLAGVATGLEQIHRAGVVHRDLKSSNVLMGDGVAKICDFGLARTNDDPAITAAGIVTGTPEYLAPELVVGDGGSPATDLYAFGCMVYEVVAGTLPFPLQRADGTQVTVADMLRAHLDHAPPELARLRRDAPPALDELAQRLLSKKPAQRPGAAEVASALEALASRPRRATGLARPVEPLDETPTAPITRPEASAPVPRRAGLALLLAGFTVVLVLLAVALARRPPAVPEPSLDPDAPVRFSAARARLDKLMRKGHPFQPPAEDVAALVRLFRSGVADRALALRAVTGLLSEAPRPDQDEWLGAAGQGLNADLDLLRDALVATKSPHLPPARVEALVARAHGLAGRRADAVACAKAALRSHPRSVALHAVLLELGAGEPLPTGQSYLEDLDGSEMVLVPTGTFTMGALASDPDAQAYERPAHAVTLSAYFIDVRKVAAQRYKPFNDWVIKYQDHRRCATGSPCLRQTSSRGHLTMGKNSVEASAMSDATDLLGPNILELPERQFELPDRAAVPVTSVSWWDAVAFARAIGHELPTEAQWEKAARGTTPRRFPWGETMPTRQMANFGSTDLTHQVERVDAYESVKTPYGAIQMGGNGWEWCADEYDDGIYARRAGEPVTDPQVEPAYTSRLRVQRGGAAYSSWKRLRCSDRDHGNPNEAAAHGWTFRTVRRLKPL